MPISNEKINYTNYILERKWYPVGSKLWSSGDNALHPETVTIDNGTYSFDDVFSTAIGLKRNGNYDKSIELYLLLCEECRMSTGRIPLPIVRGLFKVLVAANCFILAHNLLATVCADLEDMKTSSYEDRYYFSEHWKDFNDIAIMVIDNDDYEHLLNDFCAPFSGNKQYMFCRSYKEIHSEFEVIRNAIRRVYGR